MSPQRSARRLGLVSRAALVAAVSGALAQGSCAAPPAPVLAVPALCVPAHLAACEQRLAGSLASPSRSLAAAYAAARAARDAGDPWARLYRELDAADRGSRPRTVIVLAGNAPSAPTGARVVTVPDLPAPAAIPAEDLLLALAAATGYDHLVLVRGAAVTQLFPGDPLAPFMGGLRPVLREADALATIEGDLAAEELLRTALEAAGSFHYVDAARAAASLSALRPRGRPRYRYALQLLASAGLVLDADESAASTARPVEPTSLAPAPPAADDTPYGSYLRVVTARDARKEWEVRGPRVLEGIAEDRREAFASLFSPARDCSARRAPKVESARDLVFAGKVAGALSRSPAAPLTPAELPLREWLSLYQTTVDLVSSTHTAWSYLPALLSQRGEAPGLRAAGTPLYERVTQLGLAHLAAIRELSEAYPVQSRASAQMSLSVSPGLLGDDALREGLIQLTEASVQGKLAAAKDAEALLLGIATGAAAGLSYPPALQEAHFRALARAADGRLEGDFLHKTGWGVAALYALDAIHRLMARSGQSLAFSSRQIARALNAPDVEPPALAALAIAAARYAALAADRRLDPGVIALDKPTPERREARDELRAALAGLGASGEAPNNVLDDVTTLTDGLVASLGAALVAGAAKKAPPKPGTCAPRAPAAPLDPELRRTLARLGDVRRRILLHPRYKEGDGLWVRRVRLLVTVLSDAMDLVLGSDVQKAPVFAVPAGEAQRVIADALRELDSKAVTEVVLGGYGLFRELTSAGQADALLKKATPDLERVAAGLFALFRGDLLGGKGPAMGVTFLDALASVHLDAPRTDSLVATLAAYASAFYEKKQADQGDVCLLAGLLVSALTRAELPPSVLDLAARNESRLAWVLRFSQEVRRRKAGEAPDPSAYAEGMRRATDDACQAPDAEATLAVMGAIKDRAAGKNEEAVRALDRVLDQADDKGLGVPRMNLRYEEKTATKVFSVSVDVSYGSGILLAGNTFQLGLGLRSGGEPQGALTSTLLPLDTAQSGEDAARYYVYTAALATVYHLLDGDTDGAVATGQRVVAALEGGLKLGSRALRAEKQASWGEDAREIIIVAAQLAAEAGLPFLAGDLWTVVRAGLADTLDDAWVKGALDALPLGLGGIAALDPVVARARRSLAILAAPLPCTDAKVELGGFEEVACAGYPLALSLRIADVLKKLPRLRRGGHSGGCGALRSLDTFLAGADRGAYDPDAFTRAVEDLRADGRIYDAAILLSRHRRPSHCNATLVSSARALGRSPLLGPWIESNLLGAAVDCTGASGGPDVEADLLAIDEDTRKLPDPSRNLRLVFEVADRASRTDRWGTLARLVDQPSFVGRWMNIHPTAAAAALLLEHAVAVIGGKEVPVAQTRGSFQLLCETFKAPDRAEVCGMIEALQVQRPPAERERFAREAVRKLLDGMASPPPAKKRKP